VLTSLSDPCPLNATLARWPRCLGPYLKHLHPLVHAPAQYRVSQSLVCSIPAQLPYACTCTTSCGRHNLRGAFSTAQCLLAPYPADTAGLVNTRAAIDLGTRAAAPPLQEIGVTCSHQALYWQQGDQACAMAIFCKLHPCCCRCLPSFEMPPTAAARLLAHCMLANCIACMRCFQFFHHNSVRRTFCICHCASLPRGTGICHKHCTKTQRSDPHPWGAC
jgi:hypothetical protein